MAPAATARSSADPPELFIENPTISASMEVANARIRTLAGVMFMQDFVLSLPRYASLIMFNATHTISAAPIHGAQLLRSPVMLAAIRAPSSGIPNCEIPKAPPRVSASRLSSFPWHMPMHTETEKASMAIEAAVAKVLISVVMTGYPHFFSGSSEIGIDRRSG